MFFPPFFNTKSSSLLEDEHHVAVGSQNINKPRALINSKNLQHSSTHTISKCGVANRGEQSPARPPGHIPHPCSLTSVVSAGTRAWGLARTPGAADLQGRTRGRVREWAGMAPLRAQSCCWADRLHVPQTRSKSWLPAAASSQQATFLGSSTPSELLHQRELWIWIAGAGVG